MKKKKHIKLDKDEQALSDSFDRDEWKAVVNRKTEAAIATKAAANTLRKNEKNIRLSSYDHHHFTPLYNIFNYKYNFGI
jgi:predicted DNA binding CopG/RHH family protein